MDDNSQWESGPNCYGGLDVDVLLDDSLAGLVGAFLGRLPNRLNQTALPAAEADLSADAEQRRNRNALEQRQV